MLQRLAIGLKSQSWRIDSLRSQNFARTRKQCVERLASSCIEQKIGLCFADVEMCRTFKGRSRRPLEVTTISNSVVESRFYSLYYNEQHLWVTKKNALAKLQILTGAFFLDISNFCFVFFHSKCGQRFASYSDAEMETGRVNRHRSGRPAPVGLPVGSGFFERPVKPVERPVKLFFFATKRHLRTTKIHIYILL